MTIHIPDFQAARVLVVGDVMLDRYWHGGASRISPEAPVPVVRVGETEDRPGGAGNVALNLAALGGGVTLVGVTGADESAALVEAQLAAAGVDCRFEKMGGAPTITKLRVISRHQQLIRLDFEQALPAAAAAAVLAHARACLPQCQVVLLSDYGKGTLAAAPELIAAARRAGRPVLVDPKGRDFSRYRGATVVTPNWAEFEAVAGECPSEEDMVVKARALLEAHNLGAVLVTRGEQGMSLMQGGRPPLHLPTRAQEVYDVTGAGDTVISTLAAALASGESLEQATALANLAAGVVVAKLGTATVSVPELRRAQRDSHVSESGVLSEAQLLAAAAQARAHGDAVVMTNGCFDILHPGHVAYLDQARKLGDRLIVAVNDDASVRRLKGPSRPINPLDYRLAMLASLKSVDWVVPFSEDTPERLICAVGPDYLVKGGDYRPEAIAGYGCVTGRGGKVIVLDYVDGHSTSRIIEKIKEQA
ncbi:MAG TPA: bifunctional D-glycero-beta-D-manno-heptose-7-phosphate kinase/D-glycero-beta-D-manno-heptose 1-phosphate adenylyltransferase HldE [Gammaproteobacteria bacterium]|nr:bifunctional D-glycero-beta-D-manno-heptose-7-phosphate kinase/D-glycero-beta-D-manno-heptose 1-phosphate adenylyltransferase HldE [Gammaproteobacteria bacterium]